MITHPDSLKRQSVAKSGWQINKLHVFHWLVCLLCEDQDVSASESDMTQHDEAHYGH
jgi:hypothetical protein